MDTYTTTYPGDEAINPGFLGKIEGRTPETSHQEPLLRSAQNKLFLPDILMDTARFQEAIGKTEIQQRGNSIPFP